MERWRWWFSIATLYSSPAQPMSVGLSGELNIYIHLAAMRLNATVQNTASLY